MIGAAGSEFVILCSSIFETFSTCFSKSKSKKKSKKEEGKKFKKIDKIRGEGSFGSADQKIEREKRVNQPFEGECEIERKNLVVPCKINILAQSRKMNAMKSLAEKRKNLSESRKSSVLGGWNFEERGEEGRI